VIWQPLLKSPAQGENTMKTAMKNEVENPAITERIEKQTPKAAITLFTFQRLALNAILALLVLGWVCEGLANAQVRHVDGLTVLNVENPQADVDFVNAKPMPLPNNLVPMDQTQGLIEALTSTPELGTAGYSSGAKGLGITKPIFLGKPAVAENNELTPDFGTHNHPFTTARADLHSLATNTEYPYSAAGKLFFKIGTASYKCSAALIKRGIAVTAAQCVANYGHSEFYGSWQFVPGYRNGSAPFGTWTVKQVWIKHAYYNGTDNCAVYGVVCPDDVAVLILNTQSGGYPGTSTGWLGYGYNGYGFTSNGLTEISQLGYSVGLDNAAYMERNDSQGYVNASNSKNTVIGSNMNGGSSGGPWIANFGLPAKLTGETGGSDPVANVVVGVTSWGYTSTALKEQGASPFTSNNIVSLLNSACGATPAACR
jgi:V8-like Glu-specific endopeptidase